MTVQSSYMLARPTARLVVCRDGDGVCGNERVYCYRLDVEMGGMIWFRCETKTSMPWKGVLADSSIIDAKDICHDFTITETANIMHIDSCDFSGYLVDGQLLDTVYDALMLEKDSKLSDIRYIDDKSPDYGSASLNIANDLLDTLNNKALSIIHSMIRSLSLLELRDTSYDTVDAIEYIVSPFRDYIRSMDRLTTTPLLIAIEHDLRTNNKSECVEWKDCMEGFRERASKMKDLVTMIYTVNGLLGLGAAKLLDMIQDMWNYDWICDTIDSLKTKAIDTGKLYYSILKVEISRASHIKPQKVALDKNITNLRSLSTLEIMPKHTNTCTIDLLNSRVECRTNDNFYTIPGSICKYRGYEVSLNHKKITFRHRKHIDRSHTIEIEGDEDDSYQGHHTADWLVVCRHTHEGMSYMHVYVIDLRPLIENKLPAAKRVNDEGLAWGYTTCLLERSTIAFMMHDNHSDNDFSVVVYGVYELACGNAVVRCSDIDKPALRIALKDFERDNEDGGFYISKSVLYDSNQFCFEGCYDILDNDAYNSRIRPLYCRITLDGSVEKFLGPERSFSNKVYYLGGKFVLIDISTLKYQIFIIDWSKLSIKFLKIKPRSLPSTSQISKRSSIKLHTYIYRTASNLEYLALTIDHGREFDGRHLFETMVYAMI